MPAHHGQTYERRNPASPTGWTRVEGTRRRDRIKRALHVAGITAGIVVAGAGLWLTLGPQGSDNVTVKALLAINALAVGGAAWWLGSMVGAIITEPRWEALAPMFRREFYDRHAVATLLMLGMLAAVFGLLCVHGLHWKRTGDDLSAVTFLILAGVLAYPFIRHRIERGRWPN